MLDKLHAKAAPSLNKLPIKAQSAYVDLLFAVISRALVSASRTDPVIQAEVKAFPVGHRLRMMVLPKGQHFTLEVTERSELTLVDSPLSEPADLTVKFKQLSLAFRVFSLQESTAAAFASDRIVADGDVSDAIRLVRCLNRVEAVILPKSLASLAIKSYPEMSLSEKLGTATKIFGGFFKK